MSSVKIYPVKKTTWQRIYSILGFWMYYSYDNDGNKIATVYWCCFPFLYLRKFDLFSHKIT